MKMKKVMAMAIIMAMSTAALFGCGKEKTNETLGEPIVQIENNDSSDVAPSEETTESEITVITHHVSCQKDGKEIANGSYPEIILSDSFTEKYPKLKEYFEEFNQNKKNWITENVAQYGAWQLEDPNYPDEVFTSDCSVEIVRADDNLFSILMYSFDWAGGAHPSHYTTSYNIDPVTANELGLSDCLSDTSRLSEGIRTELEKNYQGIMEEVDSFYFMDEDDDPDQFVNKLNENSYTFAITDKGLEIFFSPYEIASYAAGELDVALSYDEYPDLVQKAFVMDNAQDMEKIVTTKDDTDNVTVVEPEGQEEDIASEQYIDNPSWNYYLSDAAGPAADSHISLTKLTEEKSDWVNLYDWCQKNGFEEANLCHEDDEYFYSPYYPVEYDYMYNGLYIYDKDMTNMLYNLNMLKVCNGPDDEAGQLIGATEYIRYAFMYDGLLYAEISHQGYMTEEPKNGYIVAIDPEAGKVVFKSEPLVANSGNFKIVNDTIICGYGFTAEPDYIYLLDRFTGEKVETIPVASAADQFEIVGDTLYVATYNTEYTFKIEK
ncbi:DUF3298 domain-containing protein [Butyrivibrio sp. CB08]|uniref:DUF3298 and DUF4163 domain-containing protein n=1 Tax=Butyrivibrio sp. CB08 TaxID=2364879 RepID=UPI000EAAA70C|nr:DUF3298 and DUF4163 domain-containing protein [Butyrivibrio sp. CB08]RKM57556.1 DUF3298 domain-containing protein [Butyrivibrio sp. CB08]